MPMGLQVLVLFKLSSVAASKSVCVRACLCVRVKDGGSSVGTKKPSMFCLPAGVMATVFSFPPQESFHPFLFQPMK